MRGPKRIDLKKIVDKGLDLAKRSAEVIFSPSPRKLLLCSPYSNPITKI